MNAIQIDRGFFELNVEGIGNKVKVETRSPFSMASNVIEIDMPLEEIIHRLPQWSLDNKPIQDVFPEWTDEQREIFVSGFSGDEFDQLFDETHPEEEMEIEDEDDDEIQI